jgi:exopolysaccharide biosynthesis polyprenyl glycosylphosphotransferase
LSIAEISRKPSTGGATGISEAQTLAAPAPPGLLAGRARRLAAMPRTTAVQRVLVAADAVAVSVALAWALGIGGQSHGSLAQLAWTLPYLPVFLLLFKLYGLYDGDRRRLGHSTLDDVPGVFHAAVMATLGLWGYLKLAPVDRLVFVQVVLTLGLTIVLSLATRAAVRSVLPRLVAPERVLLLGAGPSAHLLVRKLRADRRRGMQLVGSLCDEGAGYPPAEPGVARLGAPDDLAQVCQVHAVERVMIASPAIESERLTELIREANRENVSVTLLPSALDVLGPSTEVDELEGVTVLAVNPARFTRSSALLKRGLDVTLSSLALVVLLPLLPVVAAAIKLDSPGPVFFKQRRLGRGGRVFVLIKLRTMVADAEARGAALQADSGHAAWLLLDRDPRVTRLGRFLRVTSIDELPQLWNVLRGEMSLVGPRPMPVATGQHIHGWGRRRQDLTPGLTGMWQVLGRTTIPFEEMIKLDYLYVTNWSVWRDVRLLLRTVSVVLMRRGAN